MKISNASPMIFPVRRSEVLASDNYVPPFAWLNWTSFSIRWSERNVGPRLLSHLEAVVASGRYRQLAVRVAEVSCWFVYDEDAPCSAFQGTLRELARRAHSTPTLY